jgi:hypothetical protein
MNRPWLHVLCAGALALTSLLAHAQYSWLDDKGTRVFSDRPPPPGMPPSRILKAPAMATPVPQATDPVIPEWKKRDAEFRERLALRERQEEAAEAASDAVRRNERTARCNWAKSANLQLRTAPRLYRTTPKGQVVFLSDADRAGEQEKVKRTLSGCS